jgi:hypothetical protein
MSSRVLRPFVSGVILYVGFEASTTPARSFVPLVSWQRLCAQRPFHRSDAAENKWTSLGNGRPFCERAAVESDIPDFRTQVAIRRPLVGCQVVFAEGSPTQPTFFLDSFSPLGGVGGTKPVGHTVASS